MQIVLFIQKHFSIFFRYGRRTSFFMLLFMEVTVSIITCFAPNYTVFTVLRTLNGVTFPALFQIPFILCKFQTFLGLLLFLICQMMFSFHFFNRPRNHGTSISHFCWYDDLFVFCCGIDDFGWSRIHF